MVVSLNGQSQLPYIEECDEVVRLDSISTLFERRQNDTAIYCILQEVIKNGANAVDFQLINVVKKMQQTRYDSAHFYASINYGTFGLELAKKINDTIDQLYFLDQLIHRHNRIGNYILANHAIIEGKQLSEAFGNEYYQARFIYNYAINIRRIRNQFDESILQLETYFKIIKKVDDNDETRYYYYNGVATALARSGKYIEARMYGDSALYHAEQCLDPKILGLAYSWRSWYYPLDSEEDVEYRFYLINEAIRINHSMNDREQLAANYGILAMHHFRHKEYTTALEVYEKSKVLTFSIDDKIRHAGYHRGMSYVLKALNRKEEAFDHLEIAERFYREIYDLSVVSDAMDLQYKNEQLKKEKQIEALDFEKKMIDNKLERQKTNFLLVAVLVGMLLLLGGLYLFFKRQKEKLILIRREQETNKRIVELENKALRSQMNPHFIFNCLNSIKSYIAVNEPRIATNYLNKFAHLIRLILSHSSKKLISLEDEIKALRLYVDLERLRLGEDFNFNIKESHGGSKKWQLPPLILQPFIENAIWHGLRSKEGPKEINVNIIEREDHLEISIQDNGIGRKAAGLDMSSNVIKESKSLGTSLTKHRLQIESPDFKGNVIDIIDLEDESGQACGTEVIIRIEGKESS